MTPYFTKDVGYYIANCQFLLGQTTIYYPQYSIGVSIIGIPIFLLTNGYTQLMWISAFIMCLFSSLTVFLVGKIAEQWYTKGVGILASFVWVLFPFLEFFAFQNAGYNMFRVLIGFTGFMSDSVSLFFVLLTIYYLNLIVFSHKYKEQNRKLCMICGVLLGLALTMRITNIALLFVTTFVFCFLRELNDESSLWEKNWNFREKLIQIIYNLSIKIRSISRENAIFLLIFVGFVFVAFLPELLLKVMIGGHALQIINGTYLDGTGYYLGIKVRTPWGRAEFFSTSNFRNRFLMGLQVNCFFIAFLVLPYMAYYKLRRLPKLLPILIFFAYLSFYSFWSYYPLLNLRFLLPAFPFCFISACASVMKIFELLVNNKSIKFL
jgi:hypothetical protein